MTSQLMNTELTSENIFTYLQNFRLLKYRSSHQKCSVRKGVLRNFAKFTWKHLCQSLFLNKVAGLRLATLLKKRISHRCFHENFAKFLRTTTFFHRIPLAATLANNNTQMNNNNNTKDNIKNNNPKLQNFYNLENEWWVSC